MPDRVQLELWFTPSSPLRQLDAVLHHCPEPVRKLRFTDLRVTPLDWQQSSLAESSHPEAEAIPWDEVLAWLQPWDHSDYAYELTQLWPVMQWRQNQWQAGMGRVHWLVVGPGFDPDDPGMADRPSLRLDWGEEAELLAEGAGWDDAARLNVGKNVRALTNLARHMEKVPGLRRRVLGLESGGDLVERVRARFYLLQ